MEDKRGAAHGPAPRPAPDGRPDTLGTMSDPRSDAASRPAATPTGPPPGRYDGTDATSGLSGKVIAVLLAALVVALLAAGAFTLYRFSATPSISGQVIGVEVIDEHRTDVVVDVTRDEPDKPVYCILRAQDQTKGEVGRREVYVPPSEDGTVRFDATIATTARAVIGDVYGCGEDVPAHLRR